MFYHTSIRINYEPYWYLYRCIKNGKLKPTNLHPHWQLKSRSAWHFTTKKYVSLFIQLWEADKGQAEWEVEADECVWEAMLANHLEDWD